MDDQRRGRRLGIPYDWRRPSAERAREAHGDPGGRLLKPKSFGWGWTLNLGALRRLGRRRR